MKAIEFITEATVESLQIHNKKMFDQLYDAFRNKDQDIDIKKSIDDGKSSQELCKLIAARIFNSVGEKYLIWTVKQYISDRYFFLHDLDTWKSDLEKFAQVIKDRRIQIQRDIGRYKNISELRNAIEQASGKKQEVGSAFYGKIIAAVDKYVKKGEATWLYRSNEYSIYHPKSFESSNLCKAFMTTNVCTIMNSDHFNSYSSNGTLLYIITQDKLYNCYIKTSSGNQKSEFSDEKNDHKYDLPWMISQFPQLKPIIQKIMTPYTDFQVKLVFAKSEKEKRDMYMTAVEYDGAALNYVPNELRDRGMCMTAVKSSGSALYFVPNELRDRDMCMTAVKSDGRALQYVPNELRDREMCITAVKSGSYYSLAYVPKPLRDREMCMTVVKSDGAGLQFVPNELRDRDMCMTAVKSDGYALQYVPQPLRDRDMCITAVKSDGSALEYVPDNLRDRDMCMTAVKSYGSALEFVPDNLRDRDMCMTAVKSRGYALEFVPDNLRDRDMYMTAVKSNSQALAYVTNELRDREMCMTAVKSNGSALQYVPKSLRDREMCMTAVKSNGYALYFVPNDPPEYLRDRIRQELRL